MSTQNQSAQAIIDGWKGLLPDLLGIELLEAATERVSARMLVRP